MMGAHRPSQIFKNSPKLRLQSPRRASYWWRRRHKAARRPPPPSPSPGRADGFFPPASPPPAQPPAPRVGRGRRRGKKTTSCRPLCRSCGTPRPRPSIFPAVAPCSFRHFPCVATCFFCLCRPSSLGTLPPPAAAGSPAVRTVAVVDLRPQTLHALEREPQLCRDGDGLRDLAEHRGLREGHRHPNRVDASLRQPERVGYQKSNRRARTTHIHQREAQQRQRIQRPHVFGKQNKQRRHTHAPELFLEYYSEY